MIEGVEIKELLPHEDERGFFCELIRNSDDLFQDNFGQLSHSMALPGIFKAWHLHKKQTEWMCVLVGDVKLALYDTRKDSKTYNILMEIFMGEQFGRKVVRVPAGVAHGYKIINGPMHIIYVANREYDPKDQLTIPHDEPSIGYDWLK